jgi:putative transposase
MGAFGGKLYNGIGKTQGGWTTRIHAVVDAKGLPLRIKIAPGNRNDNLFAKVLLKGQHARNVIADLAYDTDEIRYYLMTRNERAVIPSHPKRTNEISYSKRLYKKRSIVENFFQKLKSFRRVATRYDKLGKIYRGLVIIACIIIYIAF